MGAGMSLFREESGKVSMGRVFGGLCMISVIAGWWIAFMVGKDLPELTNEILAIALMPYGVGKFAGAVQAMSKNGSVTTAMDTK